MLLYKMFIPKFNSKTFILKFSIPQIVHYKIFTFGDEFRHKYNDRISVKCYARPIALQNMAAIRY